MEDRRGKEIEKMIRRSTMTITSISAILIIALAVALNIDYLVKANMDSVRNIAVAQIQATTTDSDNDTEESISAEANSSRLAGSQPDSSPIQGTGIPSEQTNANPAPQAPISGMEVRVQENETREGTGTFANFTNTTR
jgi:hypothetical protein